MGGSSKRFEIDMALNASDVAKGATDAKSAIQELDEAVGKVGSESSGAGSKVDDFADKLVAAARDAGKSDDDIRESLRDMGYSADNAKKAVGQLGDDFKDAGRDGARGVEKLEDALKDAQRETRDLGDDADKAGNDIRKGMKRAEDGVDEFGREAESTAKESAASFDGSAESIVDAFQEVAANAFAGFGPAGVVAGLAAALGIGAAVSGFEAVNEAEQASRERAAEWAQAFVEAGGKVLNAAVTSAKALDIATDDEKFKTAGDNAKNWGVDVSVAIAAMAGEKWALDTVNQSLIDSEEKVADAYDKAQGQYSGLAGSLDKANIEAERGRDAFNKLSEELALGGQQFDAYSSYLIAMSEHTEGATRVTDEFGDTVVTLPDGKQIYIDAETRQATDNVSSIEKKVYGIKDKNVNVNVTSSGTSSAQNAIDQLVARNNGRTIQLKTRIITNGDWDQ